MTTSGVTAWSLTAGDICRTAAQEIGVLSSGEELEAAELQDCMVRLNAMLKSWATRANLFREASVNVTVTAADPSVTLPSGVREVSAVRIINSATNERPLFPWNRSQYLSLPNKAAVGAPTAYYVEKSISGITLYVWPVPATNTTLTLDYSRAAETVTNVSETLDIPEEWQEAVIKGLAARIANMFGATRTDTALVQKIAAEAADLETQLLDRDRPDSYSFEPDWAYG